MTIKISKKNYDNLKWLGKYYYGTSHRPVGPTIVMKNLIEKEMLEADPPVYQTSGFDRQD